MSKYDVIIVGSSFIGLSAAIMLSDIGLKIAIVTNDPSVISTRKNKSSCVDKTASKLFAIAESSYCLLERYGMGEEIKQNSQQINHIRVVDDNSYAKVDFSPQDIDLDCFGYMIDENIMKNILQEKFQQLLSENKNIHLFRSKSIDIIKTNEYAAEFCGEFVEMNSVGGKTYHQLKAQLIVGCDGRNSIVRKLAHISTRTKNYNQTGIVVDISHKEWQHDGVAVEKFTPSGPFAVLPKYDGNGTQSSLVWVEKGNIKKNDLLALGTTVISDLIKQKLDGYLGDTEVISEPSTYQLKLVQSEKRYANRVVLLGDAAQSIHPVAGQGVNLGLRDVKSFVSIIQKYHRMGLDIGVKSVLKEYSDSRELDVQKMIFSTNGLVGLFSNDFLPLKIFRRCGLKIFDKIDILKKFAMQYAVGNNF